MTSIVDEIDAIVEHADIVSTMRDALRNMLALSVMSIGIAPVAVNNLHTVMLPQIDLLAETFDDKKDVLGFLIALAKFMTQNTDYENSVSPALAFCYGVAVGLNIKEQEKENRE